MGDKAKSTSDQSVWNPQAKQLEGLYEKSNDWYEQNNPAIQDAANQAAKTSQAALTAAAPVWQNQLQGGNHAGYDIAGELGNRIGADGNVANFDENNPTWEYKLGQNFSGGNSSLDNMRSTIGAAALESQDLMMGGLDARAAASGMSGGSRHGVATAAGMRDINQNYQDNLSNIGYDAYNKDYDRALTMGQNADNLNKDINFANQDYGLQQQNLLADLANQQNANATGALGMQEQVQGYTNAQVNSLMQSASGLDFLQKMLGTPTVLGDETGYGSTTVKLGGNQITT